MILFVSANIGILTGVSTSITSVVMSVISMIIAAVSYFIIPKDKINERTLTALFGYLFLLGAIGWVIVQFGAYKPPYSTLWLIASIFCGMFGIRFVQFILVGITGYAALALFSGNLNQELSFAIVLGGYVPLILSYVLWHSKSSNEQNKDKAYSDLANQLNQVAGKSDAVISAINDGVIAINNNGNIELINPAALRLTGWGQQDALNLDYKSVFHMLSRDGAALDKSKDPVFEVLTTNQPVKRNDLQMQTNSGKKVNIEIVVSPIGRIGEGAILVFRDITKEQQEEKEQAEFISTASHEMRTPVASIEGYLGLALNPATATIDEKAREYITKAHESAQHLGHLFQDLLDVTKADDSRLSNNPKVIDLVSFTQDIIGGLKAKADEKQLRLFFKPVGDEIGGLKNLEPVFYVDVDADHLREVLNNLVENAIKYTPKGEVVVDVHGDEEHAVVSIADSGIGIPNEDIPHLFQKFYRVDNSDTREIGGTGLGLYLCRKLIETMGGRIWVESEYKKGSTFFVELPRISNIEAQRLIEAASAKASDTVVESKYIDQQAEVDAETEKHRQEALSIPIITSRNKSGSSDAPVYKTPVEQSATPRPPQNAADALFGGNIDSQPKVESLRSPNPMVLPAAIQDMPSNLQKAPEPAKEPAATEPPAETPPTPAPEPAPPAPVATPTSPEPVQTPPEPTPPVAENTEQKPPATTPEPAPQPNPEPKPEPTPQPATPEPTEAPQPVVPAPTPQPKQPAAAPPAQPSPEPQTPADPEPQNTQTPQETAPNNQPN